MTTYHFTVDAELLRELGERLVGKPYIALAELIKNSYDADATEVTIRFSADEIVVTDNGHGMSEDAFEARWMRVGTTNKRGQSVSPFLGRQLTGSKGVGRLAAQLLARRTQIQSRALVNPTDPVNSALADGIDARINWDAAVASGELTAVAVEVSPAGALTFAQRSRHGTRVSMTQLSQVWGTSELSELAREIWALQPPFETKNVGSFKVKVEAPDETIVQAFDTEMSNVFDLWTGRISGKLLPATETSNAGQKLRHNKLPAVRSIAESAAASDTKVTQEVWKPLLPTRQLAVEVQVRGEDPRNVIWEIDNCEIDEVEFEVRVFSLSGRQKHQIPVDEARNYISQFGGVGIYDSGFRLPTYGGSEDDWLSIDSDVSRRLSSSRLLPQELQVSEGLQDLPGNRNLIGWVAVSTNHEQSVRENYGPEGAPSLSIQVTRDRLVDNGAFQRLVVMVRASIDLYAMERARLKLKKSAKKKNASGRPSETTPSQAARSAMKTLDSVRSEIPTPAFSRLHDALSDVRDSAERAQTRTRAYASLLGTLATTGMTSLAYEHEISKQVRTVRYAANKLEALAEELSPPAAVGAHEIAKTLRDWEIRAVALRQIFAPLLRPETRDEVRRYRAKTTVTDVASRLSILARQAPVDTSRIPEDLMLPMATYPAWSSVFQNVLINAFNALHDEDSPRVTVDGGGDESSGWIRFLDNGAGVDLASADQLWEPFERALVLPPALEQAGLGGMGLGLAIVKMILDEIDVSASFEAPPDGYRTALRIKWRDQ
ncbi:ATP-binding protein [Microbacterium sp. C5A9]|uniref:ATP-binding protein n=1 Tax=Microbacterium sp. C5A9 TaxID=2736663 RepID=UPI001F51D41E|nr:ATP-binding protein [Microbacterium sp. C5A9]MCI1019658.1 ATP-binding protein [Microbacterium sp. C5A9]